MDAKYSFDNASSTKPRTLVEASAAAGGVEKMRPDGSLSAAATCADFKQAGE
jgi:hypothetical protein